MEVRGPGRYKLEKMKVRGPGRYKLEQGRNSWQSPEHAWLYSGLVKEGTCQLYILNAGELDFCVRSASLRVGTTRRVVAGISDCMECVLSDKD